MFRRRSPAHARRHHLGKCLRSIHARSGTERYAHHGRAPQISGQAQRSNPSLHASCVTSAHPLLFLALFAKSGTRRSFSCIMKRQWYHACMSKAFPIEKTFKGRVLDAVRAVPAGETRSYAEIARLAGSPQAARSVGSIMKANTDLSVPCHSVRSE